MTREVIIDGRIGLVIENEPVQKCELCGVIEETRPYGPNGEQICFGCGMKNPTTTLKKYSERLDNLDFRPAIKTKH